MNLIRTFQIGEPMLPMRESETSVLNRLAEAIYLEIARQFPICCASDEFYFFPQLVEEGPSRWGWDDFSAAAVADFAAQTERWEAELQRCCTAGGSLDEQIDLELLLRMLRNLREQLLEIAPQRHQPSFHLTVVVAGLSEALASDNPAAWQQRISQLPGFLARAAATLEQLPRLFLAAGLQMLGDVQTWFDQLQNCGWALGGAAEALQRFAEALRRCPVQEPFSLPDGLFARVVEDHLGCRASLDDIQRELREEYAAMEALLSVEAERLVPGQRWQEAEARIPFLAAPGGDLLQLYAPELKKLENHARQAGLVPELAGQLSPELAAVPASLAAIRASDAYSAKVGHPARGGTFLVYDQPSDNPGPSGRTLEYRFTAAHETWPGHHLLDLCRWNQPRPIRRPLEQPLFYEGWACFAEQLLFDSGYFAGPWDRFLLARRRIERAARGLVDIGLQSGAMTVSQGAQQLVEVGYAPQVAATVVPKYALRPGYQVCYTLGLRRVLQLREELSELADGTFARRLLEQGEVGFAALRRLLLRGGD